MPPYATLPRILAVAAVATVATIAWLLLRPDVQTSRSHVTRLFLRGDYGDAEQAANTILEVHPELHGIRMIAAESAARVGHVGEALTHLSLLRTKDRKLALKASLLEAELAHRQTFEITRAVNAYHAALRIDPENVQALDGLVRILAACGRRQETIPSLLRLVRAGWSSDLLTIATRASGAINDPELLQNCANNFPEDCGALLGLALHAEQAGNLDHAISLCEQAVTIDAGFTPAWVAFGHYLLEADRFEELETWNSKLPDECSTFAETWRIRGYLAEHQGDLQTALECFLRAARGGPTLKDVYHRISRLLRKAGDEAAAGVFTERLRQIQELETQQDWLFATGPQDAQVIVPMIRQFQKLGRLWEAYGWTQIALVELPNNSELQRLYADLAIATRNLPLELATESGNIALNYSSETFRLPAATKEPGTRDSVPANSDSPGANFSFRNDADLAGLHFTYNNGVVGPTSHRMFEFTGGGMAAVDFDLDDFPDLFCSQGHLWQTRRNNENNMETSDSLFRNVRGLTFVEAAATAGISGLGFGQGVAVGDIDGDGFPDIFVANIGQNDLWMNNGDGTFENRSDVINQGKSDGQWTTSALIADLNSDGAADLYAANYLQGEGVFDRICETDGVPEACIPSHFDGVSDILLLNDLHGGFRDASMKLTEFAPGKSLGVAAWSTGNDGKLSLLVTNDTTPNMLLSVGSGADGLITERAFDAGIAVNGQGKAEGCMGIAIGDVDSDGYCDAFVTNFYNETNTLYKNVSGLFFEDKTDHMNLSTASLPSLGFGTQFLDADLDGSLEIFVANGHVDDLRHRNKPYQMPAQFFYQKDESFVEATAEDLGDYFLRTHLGRSVVCLDWNGDGQSDIGVGHLSEPYALLTNTCPNLNQGVTMRFVGVSSSRDAVGLTVSWQLESKTITRQITAGDGYQASNQREVWLACDATGQISTLNVTWPNGHTQTIHEIPGGTRGVLREDVGRWFPLP